MKTRTALIIAAILGLITYSLPLYAIQNHEYHLEERTTIQIPIVGKISTHTQSYLSGCKLKESTTIKMHNALVKMMSDSNGRSFENQLSDLCDKIQWKYDEETGTYISHSFEKVRQDRAKYDTENDIQIDMGSDQNDITDLPRMTHEILGYEKNINGFKARKVVTRVFREKAENPVIIEEYYSTDVKPLEKITSAREQVSHELGEGENHVEGVPSFIKAIYDSIREDRDLDRPEGKVVRFVISMLDDDDDPLFTMNYDVLVAEETSFQEDHFSLK